MLQWREIYHFAGISVGRPPRSGIPSTRYIFYILVAIAKSPPWELCQSHSPLGNRVLLPTLWSTQSKFPSFANLVGEKWYFRTAWVCVSVMTEGSFSMVWFKIQHSQHHIPAEAGHKMCSGTWLSPRSLKCWGHPPVLFRDCAGVCVHVCEGSTPSETLHSWFEGEDYTT